VEKIERCNSDIEMDSDELDEDMSCSDGSGSDSEEYKELSVSLLPFSIFFFFYNSDVFLKSIKAMKPAVKKGGFWSNLFGGSKSKQAEPESMQMDMCMAAKPKIEKKQKKSKITQRRFSRAKKHNRKFIQEVDTNIVSIGFDILEQDAQLVAGDATFCLKCNSVFSKHSILTKPNEVNQGLVVEDAKVEEDVEGNQLDQVKQINEEVFDEDEQLWVCEYCYHRNIINLEKEEIPTEDAVNYILEVAESKGGESKSDVSVVFCLDVSGSM
jgi:hypothetical protein